jgi:hypothetical protein
MTELTITQFLQEEEQMTGAIWDYVSPSRLSLWMKCPLAFRRRYIEGLTTTPSPALFVGKVVHSVLAYAYRLRDVGQNCTVDDLPMLVADGWKFGMETEPPYFENEADEEKSRYQILDLVKAYFNSIPIQDEVPIAVECKYEVPLINPLTGKDFGIPLLGVVDLVLKEDCGNVITDFKTAATSTLCELSHELQLTAYAYLFREATGQEELRCEIRQLIKTKTPKIMTHRFPRRTDEHFARFFGLIREYIDALDKGVYNFRPSWTCGTMCEHYTACAC